MIDDALLSSLALAARIEGEIASWHRREGHTASFAARELAKLTLGIASQMRSDVEGLVVAHHAGGTVELDDIVALNQRALAAEDWHDLLESTTHRSLHPVLSPTVRAELEALGVLGQVLVASVRDVSYEILTLSEGSFTGLVADHLVEGFTWPFFIFRVPSEPLDWPLHHVLLYHEIGHALLAAKGGLPLMKVPPEHDPAQTTDFEDRFRRAEHAETFIAASAAWLEEFYADAVGLCLAGPAYIIAFSRLLGTFFRLDTPSETHPPVALRIRLLVGALHDLGYAEPLPDEVQRLIDGWLNMASSVSPSGAPRELAPILEVLMTGVQNAHREIVQLAISHVGARRYTAAEFGEDWKRGRLLATLHIPPIEAGDLPSVDEPGVPLEPARVFSACWGAYLQGDKADVAAADRYAQAILGSLEGVEALRNWRSS